MVKHVTLVQIQGMISTEYRIVTYYWKADTWLFLMRLSSHKVRRKAEEIGCSYAQRFSPSQTMQSSIIQSRRVRAVPMTHSPWVQLITPSVLSTTGQLDLMTLLEYELPRNSCIDSALRSATITIGGNYRTIATMADHPLKDGQARASELLWLSDLSTHPLFPFHGRPVFNR